MRLLVVGAGGHGVVVADAAATSNKWSGIIFIDDAYPELAEVGNWKVHGKARSFQSLQKDVDAAVVAVGDNVVRLRLLAELEKSDVPLATVIHPSAAISTLSEIGGGTVVLANAVVNSRTRIGKGCIINSGAVVEHDCDLADGVHIAPGATLAADVDVGESTWIGAGAAIRERISIGSGVVVGLGAAVIRDVGAGQTVAGVPAKPIRSADRQQP